MLSVPWLGGASEDVIEGVRNSRVDFWEMRRGRKALIVVNGASRCVVRVSDQCGGVIVLIEDGV